jgi:GntR family transcriptional regulator, arabinose operon transcriptional repressor
MSPSFMSVENHHRRFLYQRLYDHILDEIRGGRLSAGDRVPSEMELANLFGVSRITSKKALQTLNRDGVVERIIGKGTFVAAQLPSLDRLSSPEAALRSRRAERSCIGFVLPAFSPAFEIGLLEGVEARTAELGLNLIVRRTHGRQDVEEQVIDSLMSSELVDGLIVFAVNGDYYNRSLLRLVLEQAPLVLADRALNGIAACAVTTDNHAAALELTGTLLGMGHEHLAFVSAPVNNTASLEDRLAGFRAAHRGRRESTQNFLTTLRSTPNMPSVGGDTDADRAAIAQLLDEHPEITAFVAAEYQFAVLVHEVLASLGRLDGRTIACFDMPDLPFAPHDFLHVRQDERAMGRLAVDLLVAQVNDGEVPPVSTVPYAIVDPTSRQG